MFTLEIEKRDTIGKANKRLKSGDLPAVYYGHKTKSTPITLSRQAFKKVLRGAGESSVVILKDKEGKDTQVLIYGVDYDPVKSEPRHVDFYVVEKGEKVTVSVPVHFEGIPPAVKNLGGILVKVMHEIEIEAEPIDLPHSIIVDVNTLEAFDSKILIKDISFPKGVVSTEDEDEVVASISEPKEEKEETIPVDLSAIEVEKKGKKEEEGESKEEASKE